MAQRSPTPESSSSTSVSLASYAATCPSSTSGNPPTGSPSNAKKQLPVLVVMTILGTCLSKAPDIPPCLEAVVREVRLDHVSTRGLARTTSHCIIPTNCMATVPVTGNQQTTSHLLASPLAQPLPGGLMLIPTLVSKEQ